VRWKPQITRHPHVFRSLLSPNAHESSTSLRGAVTTVNGNGQLTTVFVNIITDIPVPVNPGSQSTDGLGTTDKIALGVGLGIGLPLIALLIILIAKVRPVGLAPRQWPQNPDNEMYRLRYPLSTGGKITNKVCSLF
jgi:hypothetical protein